ncbi:MAG: TetR/AcrR family transcriptional regulator [Acidimicrobiales bacterium]
MTRGPLSAEEILRAALRLVDAEGLDALTMRRLGSELGVATMSLYGHVPNKDEVLLGVVNLVTADIGLPGPETPPWEALRRVTREFRRVALAHPNLVPLIVRRPPTGAEGLLTLEAALDALRRAGIEPSLTARAYRLMSSFAIGFVSLECGGFFKPVDVAAGEVFAPIDASAVPRVAEVGPYLADWDADREFEGGMDALIGVLSGWAGSTAASEVVEHDSGRGGDVEGVDLAAHPDPDLSVSSS